MPTNPATIGQSRPAQGRRALSHRRGPVHRRRVAAAPDRTRISCARRTRTRTIRSIDTAKAKAAPGVVAVFTGADLDRRQRPAVRLAHHRHRRQADEGAAASGARARARCATSAITVALVIAETRDQAKDAAELIDVDYEVLPAVVNAADALQAGRAAGPRRGAGQHVLHVGDRRQGGGRRGVRNGGARDQARHRQQPARFPTRSSRAPRSRRTTAPRTRTRCTSPSQNPHVERLLMTAFVLGLPEHKVRVIAPDVGGGFGSKIYLYAEETAMVWASKRVNRPIKWAAERSEVVHVGRARSRSRHARRARARQGRQVPRDAGEDDGEHGRVPVDVRVVHSDDPLRDAARRAVHDAGDLLRGHGVVHQHRAGRRLSRRGAPRSDVRRRAPRASGRGRNEHPAGRDPAPQFHPHVSLPDAGRAALRHRRLRRDARRGDEASPTSRVSRRARPKRRSAASCAGSATRRTSKRAASRRRTSRARSARARACSRPAKCACIRPAA